MIAVIPLRNSNRHTRGVSCATITAQTGADERARGSKAIENRFDEQSIVCRSASNVTVAARQKVFDPIPLIIA